MFECNFLSIVISAENSRYVRIVAFYCDYSIAALTNQLMASNMVALKKSIV